MTSTPKISVIITNYNTGQYIKRCIESVLLSTYKNIEIIVIDDASTDSSADIISKYPVKFIKNKINLGSGKSRQIGIDNATGDYVIFIDSDDFITDNFIQDLVKDSNNSEFDIVIGNIISNRFGDSSNKIYTAIDIFHKINICRKHHSCFLGTLIRRTLFDRIKYCPRRIIEDSPTLYKILYYCNAVRVSTANAYYVIERPQQITKTTSPLKYFIFYCLGLIDIILFYIEKGRNDIANVFIPEFKVAKIKLGWFSNSNEFYRYNKEYTFINNIYQHIFKSI